MTMYRSARRQNQNTCYETESTWVSWAWNGLRAPAHYRLPCAHRALKSTIGYLVRQARATRAPSAEDYLACGARATNRQWQGSVSLQGFIGICAGIVDTDIFNVYPY